MVHFPARFNGCLFFSLPLSLLPLALHIQTSAISVDLKFHFIVSYFGVLSFSRQFQICPRYGRWRERRSRSRSRRGRSRRYATSMQPLSSMRSALHGTVQRCVARLGTLRPARPHLNSGQDHEQTCCALHHCTSPRSFQSQNPK